MKPPMKQRVTALVPVLDDSGKPITDKYGRPQTAPLESKARVQYKMQLVRDAQGQEQRVNLEVDIPPLFNPDVGLTMDCQLIDGRMVKGVILAKEEIANLDASKVYYRTVFVNG